MKDTMNPYGKPSVIKIPIKQYNQIQQKAFGNEAEKVSSKKDAGWGGGIKGRVKVRGKIRPNLNALRRQLLIN